MPRCLIVLALSLFASPAGCASAEHAAAKDPMKCERDPKCAAQFGKNRDCSTQCNDDPACMDRCREMQVDQGVGHR